MSETPQEYIPTATVISVSDNGTESSSNLLEFKLPSKHSAGIDKSQTAELQSQGFTKGLTESVADNVINFPLRIWVVDNSGSMTASDGHRIVSTRKDELRFVTCSRWRELQDTVEYHAQVSAVLKAPTIFRLLNNPGRHAGPQQFGIADKGDKNIPDDLQVAKTTMHKASPSGCTPLASHIRKIRESIIAMQPSLDGGKVAVILATDGLPTNENGHGGPQSRNEFIQALQGLEGLPVWIVVRLCTDEEEVVNFYNSLDTRLELDIEVLDDFMDEAREVHQYNKWLNYALPLHRCREMGFYHRLFDLLDEREFTAGEFQDFCSLLFGEDQLDGAPNAENGMVDFLRRLQTITKTEHFQWNPINRHVSSWIDFREAKRHFNLGWSFRRQIFFLR